MSDALELYGEKKQTQPLRSAPAKAFTYKDYISWGDSARWELLDGTPHMMAAPTAWHQRVSGKLFRQLDEFLDGKPCEAFIAPFDVRLRPEDDDSDIVVVQPDVLVICDNAKLSGGKACKGAPDFIIEVISDGTRGKDFGEKRVLYEKAGVREYWIVDTNRICKYVLLDGMYRETACRLDADLVLEVGALPGCSIRFREIAGLALP